MSDHLLRLLTADHLALIRDFTNSAVWEHSSVCRSDINKLLDHIELLQADLNTAAAERDRFLAENEQLRRERDTLDRFAMSETWELHMDLPNHWFEREKHYAAVAYCDGLTARMAAAFEAAPSLDELLKEEAARDG